MFISIFEVILLLTMCLLVQLLCSWLRACITDYNNVRKMNFFEFSIYSLKKVILISVEVTIVAFFINQGSYEYSLFLAFMTLSLFIGLQSYTYDEPSRFIDKKIKKQEQKQQEMLDKGLDPSYIKVESAWNIKRIDQNLEFAKHNKIYGFLLNNHFIAGGRAYGKGVKTMNSITEKC